MTITKRRVLSIATLYPNAQSPRFGTFVARSLEGLAARARWDVTVINPIGLPPVLFGRYRQLAAALQDGIEQGVMVHRPRFTLIPGIGGPFNPALIAKAILPLVRRLHAEVPFDLIDAEFFYPDGPVAMRLARELGLPYSVKARGADIQFWGQQRWTARQILEAGRTASGTLAVSEALADDMAALGMNRDRITIHYTGLDRARFKPVSPAVARRTLQDRGTITLPPDGQFVASVGALIPRKGQEFVIRALPSLPRLVLGLVGKGPDEHRLMQLARDLGVAGRVRMLGSLDHDLLPLVLSAADAMVLPSASEGLANAWVEALACGTPIVITEAGGARELLRDPKAGTIVRRDAGSIAVAVQAILDNPPAPADVAATVTDFSWEAHAERLESYFDSLVQASPRAAFS